MTILWFEDGLADVARIGGKGSSLVEMLGAGLPVPPGFCVSVDGYRQFHEAVEIAPLVGALPDASVLVNPREAASAVRPIVERLDGAELPEGLQRDIEAAHQSLCVRLEHPRLVASRSSAVSEDGATASFAGIYETYLHLAGTDRVLNSVVDCYRALWNPRAVQYRATRGIDQDAEQMAVVVMGMIPADVAGVAFSVNPLTGDDREVLINAAWGLGESVVSGQVTPDNVAASKADGSTLAYEIGDKSVEIVLDEAAGSGTILREVNPERAAEPCLSDSDVAAIAELARAAEKHYGVPQDIEFARADGQWFLLQSRPITGLA